MVERKWAEAEKKRLEIQLQRARKMEAIGILAGGIAHDFNNLLTAIRGNASLMLLGIDSLHPNYELLKNIERLVDSGARLTQQLLAYVTKREYEVKLINLNNLVKKFCDTLGRTRKDITIRYELAPDLRPIEADQGQMEQVLLNLFVNAADAMPEGGDIVMKTRNTTFESAKQKTHDIKSGNYVLLTVTDTGTGMDKKTALHIFEPFFTSKEPSRSAGLGLASVYDIVKGHGGYIEVNSQKDRGTTFNIHLPASEKESQESIDSAEGFIRGTGVVLLVDDEEALRDVGQKWLEAMGYSVLTAQEGKEAIRVYKENRDSIDIVLLDMIMPVLGGREAYEALKEINPGVKVLLLSGYSIDTQANEILKKGYDGFIQKPFTMKELSEKIREVLGDR
ncbi:MAG: response regulator [Thermodesulfobacteriota bacterium]